MRDLLQDDLSRGREVERVAYAAPGSGQDLTVTVPAGQVWWVQAMVVGFIGAGARQLYLTLSDGTNEFYRVATTVSSALSNIAFTPELDATHTLIGITHVVQASLPSPCILPSGYQIQVLDATSTDAIQAGSVFIIRL
ncbi:MAG: hypothetical protein KatS3mg015_2946 [Fimbriimonadales bacterium]|nr:MAG: hypothetical protein KatS3mg015_2946 [Fimbriimonadales bacterium]